MSDRLEQSETKIIKVVRKSPLFDRSDIVQTFLKRLCCITCTYAVFPLLYDERIFIARNSYEV